MKILTDNSALINEFDDDEKTYLEKKNEARRVKEDLNFWDRKLTVIEFHNDRSFIKFIVYFFFTYVFLPI